MGKIATVNTTDKTVLPAVKEAFYRNSNIGSSWAEARIGIFFTIVPSGNDDTFSTNETVLDYGVNNRFQFGLKDSSDVPPGQTGSTFCGITTVNRGPATDSTVIVNNNGGIGQMLIGAGGLALAYSSKDTGDLFAGGFSLSPSYPAYSAGNVNGFWGIKFVVVNAGASNQKIRLHQAMVANSAETAVTKADLETKINGATYTDTAQECTWNSGGAALALPSTLWLKLPAFNNRLRVTTYGVIKIS